MCEFPIKFSHRDKQFRREAYLGSRFGGFGLWLAGFVVSQLMEEDSIAPPPLGSRERQEQGGSCSLVRYTDINSFIQPALPPSLHRPQQWIINALIRSEPS